MKEQLLQDLIDLYRNKKPPKFITNSEIIEFFEKRGDDVTYEAFIHLRNYFHITLGAFRSSLFRLEKKYIKNEKGVFSSGECVRKCDRQAPKGKGSPPGDTGIDSELPYGYDKFREIMILRRYSPKTVKSYLGVIRRANVWFKSKKGVAINTIDSSIAKEYFMMLVDEKSLSASMIRICRFSLSFYFNAIVGSRIDFSFLEGLKTDKHLPVVLSREEIRRLLDSTRNVKHRTMLGLLYASGVRLSELIGLRVRDVSLGELVIHVKMGKGRKDRITVFSQALVEGLGKCMAGKEPADFVFTPSGGDGSAPLSGRTVQKVLEAALERAGINKKVTPHDLRHAFATHLLENGISLRHIQLLLGHKNITTTTIYTKVAHPAIRGIKSPL